MAIRSISVCAGIGGLDAGVELALGETQPIVYIERDIGAARILASRIKDGSLRPAHIWSDLATFDARKLRGKVDLIYGGLPCQPFSVAGKQLGDEDERFIWPDFLRIVRECRASVVFLENVPPFVMGEHFRSVGEELSRMGYSIEDPLFLAASDVGAPHRRERVFILAHLAHRTGGGLGMLRESSRRAGFIGRGEQGHDGLSANVAYAPGSKSGTR